MSFNLECHASHLSGRREALLFKATVHPENDNSDNTDVVYSPCVT